MPTSTHTESNGRWSSLSRPDLDKLDQRTADQPTASQRTSADHRTAVFAAEWNEWHAAHERHRADPHGFLAVTHLHWLGAEPAGLDGVPGTWSVADDAVTVVLEPGESLLRDGRELNPDGGSVTVAFGPVAERDGISLTAGAAVVELAKRGGEYIVRPRHPENPLLSEYRGTPAYAPDPRFAVHGTFAAFDEPRPTTVGAAVEGIRHVYEAPGEIRFRLDGRDLTLTAFNGHAPGTLSVLFTDQTSGRTTYAANRSLTVGAPDAEGRVTLDFNRAVNLPCAYTDLATCPLPPAENRLPVAIEAGEQIPHERQASTPPNAAPTPAPRTARQGFLALELDGDGAHPAAWRRARHTPDELLDGARIRATVLAAESAGFHVATFADGPVTGGPATGGTGTSALLPGGRDVAGRLNALQRAAFAGPVTSSIVLVPEVDTVYTEPFHVSTQLASLDYVSGGRAGWLVAASKTEEDAAAVGRDVVSAEGLAREAADSIEVSRRLWDSWEDDAVIRDVATGRYLDVDKLHYADFAGETYSVKGPSIIPRPLQGQLPVLVPAGLLAPGDLASGAADVLLVSAPTPELLAAEVSDARGGARFQSDAPTTAGAPAVVAELDVVLDARGQTAASRLAELDAHTPWQSRRARFVGTAAELTELLAALLETADGVRLHPAVLDVELEELAQLVLPALRRRGLLAPVRPDGSFRELLGLRRPASRYAAVQPAAESDVRPAAESAVPSGAEI